MFNHYVNEFNSSTLSNKEGVVTEKNKFDSSTVSNKEEVDAEQNCCLIYDANDAVHSRVDRPGVTSGPRICPSLTENVDAKLTTDEMDKIDSKYL